MVLVLHYYNLCDHCSLVLVFLFLGFALHNIHAFQSRYFYLYKIKKEKKKKGKGKGSKLCFCTIFFVFENKVGQFIFT